MVYREIREQNNMRQWEMAEELKVSESAYKKYELGYNPMPDELKITILSMEKNDKYMETVELLKRIIKGLKKYK